MVFQEFKLFPYMSAIENILVQGMVNNEVKKRDAINRAQELLCMLGMENRINHKANRLSKGQQQKVTIARALFHKPSLLLVDESTSKLDAKTGMEVTKLLKKISAKLDCTLALSLMTLMLQGSFLELSTWIS